MQGYNLVPCQETGAVPVTGDLMRLATLINLFKKSPLPGAILVFVCLNLLFFAWNPFGKVDPDALPVARNWVWWATHEYIDAPKAPKLVVLGSSVVMHPLWHHEADFRQQTVDLVADHRSLFLEDVIKKSSPLNKVECFNFGLPGSMASDDYMVVRALFKPEKKPDVVVLGICPRDMIDNRFNCAGSSKHFQYLSRFTDAHELLDLSMPQWWQRIGYQVTEAVYVASKASAAQVMASEDIKKAFEPLTSKLPPSPLDRKSEEDKRFAMYQNLVEKGFWIAKPNAPFMFQGDTADLKKRFKSPNNPMFANQKKWLDLCLELCHQKGIRVVLVNMPNTQIARSVMPPGVYERHVACLKELATRWNCLYVDADVPNLYGHTDFTDWCHLSAEGGGKAFGLIGKAIGSDQQTVACLQDKNATTSIAGRRDPGGM